MKIYFVATGRRLVNAKVIADLWNYLVGDHADDVDYCHIFLYLSYVPVEYWMNGSKFLF